jgi:hypothetical protein
MRNGATRLSADDAATPDRRSFGRTALAAQLHCAAALDMEA